VKSEGWKWRLEDLIFQGPRGLIMMELNQARNVRPHCSKHYTSGSKKCLFSNVNRNYLALGANVGKEVFVGCTWRLFEDAISREEWDEEKRKGGYSRWMEDKLVDAVYNLQPVLDKYMKL
jgi:hypothetical protein